MKRIFKNGKLKLIKSVSFLITLVLLCQVLFAPVVFMAEEISELDEVAEETSELEEIDAEEEEEEEEASEVNEIIIETSETQEVVGEISETNEVPKENSELMEEVAEQHEIDYPLEANERSILVEMSDDISIEGTNYEVVLVDDYLDFTYGYNSFIFEAFAKEGYHLSGIEVYYIEDFGSDPIQLTTIYGNDVQGIIDTGSVFIPTEAYKIKIIPIWAKGASDTEILVTHNYILNGETTHSVDTIGHTNHMRDRVLPIPIPFEFSQAPEGYYLNYIHGHLFTTETTAIIQDLFLTPEDKVPEELVSTSYRGEQLLEVTIDYYYVKLHERVLEVDFYLYSGESYRSERVVVADNHFNSQDCAALDLENRTGEGTVITGVSIYFVDDYNIELYDTYYGTDFENFAESGIELDVPAHINRIKIKPIFEEITSWTVPVTFDMYEFFGTAAERIMFPLEMPDAEAICYSNGDIEINGVTTPAAPDGYEIQLIFVSIQSEDPEKPAVRHELRGGTFPENYRYSIDNEFFGNPANIKVNFKVVPVGSEIITLWLELEPDDWVERPIRIDNNTFSFDSFNTLGIAIPQFEPEQFIEKFVFLVRIDGDWTEYGEYEGYQSYEELGASGLEEVLPENSNSVAIYPVINEYIPAEVIILDDNAVEGEFEVDYLTSEVDENSWISVEVEKLPNPDPSHYKVFSINLILNTEDAEGNVTTTELSYTQEYMIARIEIDEYIALTADGQQMETHDLYLRDNAGALQPYPYNIVENDGRRYVEFKTKHFSEWVIKENGDTKQFLYGDVNADGQVNMRDVVYLSRYLNKWAENKHIEIFKNCDLNQDGEITMRDLVILSRHLNKWTEYQVLPIQE